ncbi:RNA ligase family protein [Nocardia sp. IFM 10818]
MKLDTPINPNYAAVITKVPAVVPLEGRDRIVGLPLYGHQAIVSKGWQPGDLGVFIPAECQLSSEFASANNMFRHSELNSDPGVKGYLEDNARVKAIRLGGHRSNAMFLPLSSLAYTGVDVSQFREGDTFDHIGGYEILRKYEVRKPRAASTAGNQAPKPRRVDKKHFPEHIDTSNYWRFQHVISPDTYVWVTQKLHGTSIRVGHTIVQRKLSWVERLARKLGAKVQETQYSPVYGSRRSIKDARDPDQQNFYDTDIWTIEGKRLDGLIPAGYVVYGELIGWAHNEPIQKGYTYGLPKGTAELYVYRVTQVNPEGVTVDLGWTQLEEFCRNTGLKPVPLLWAGFHEDFDVDVWMNRRYNEEGYRHAVPLDPGKTVDEGVIVRADALTPRLLKAKAPDFLEHETKQLDSGTVDLESAA